MLVSKMFLKHSPLALSLLSLGSCPNEDPRPTVNHYLHCPFNNYSTPLHNFNSSSIRWIPVIVICLIDTIFWGHVSCFFKRYDAFKGNNEEFRRTIGFYDFCVLCMLYHARQAYFNSNFD